MGKKKQSGLVMFRIRPDVPTDGRLQTRLKRAARATGVPVSQILREAAEQRLKELARLHPEIEAA